MALGNRSAGLALLFAAVACNTGFSDQDIETLKKTVKAEFEKRPGVSVTEVNFIKESDKKLSGLIKFKVGELEVTKGCGATMGESAQYIWKCE